MKTYRALVAVVSCVLLFAAFTPAAFAQFQTIGIRPSLLKNVGIDQKLNHQVPLNLQFRDERGSTVTLGQYFTGKPVILALVYYQCPMLCTQVLNSLLLAARQMSLQMGKDYRIVTVSIDPRDGPTDALLKHRLYTGEYGRDLTGEGWHFLTGQNLQIHELADAVGFRYAYDSQSGQYAHPSVIMILTPAGKLSEYFYGIVYPARDLRLALVQASNGKIGNPVDALLLLCCSYNATTGRYGLVISRVIKFAAALTLFALALLIFYLRRRENYSLPGKRA
ncbi:MAG: SCO family protein [Candidatus Acidiferrales bacterium]